MTGKQRRTKRSHNQGIVVVHTSGNKRLVGRHTLDTTPQISQRVG